MERERRARVSRIITIDGHQVLRANNYDLESGEQSVWDKELGEKPMVIDESIQRVPKVSVRKSSPKQKPEKKLPIETTARSRMREMIKAEIEARAPLRAAFAVQYAHIFQAFGFESSNKIIPASSFSTSIPHVEPPAQISATLRPHQRDGLNWLSYMYDNGLSCILGDEMGLGKTIQTISLLAHLKFTKKFEGPSIVVCPLSVISSWMIECKRFAPALRVIKLHSSDPHERDRLKAVVRDQEGFDLVVTTYEMMKSPAMGGTLAGSTWFRMLILDEGHLVKNELSDVAKAARRMHFGHCLLLTGTPLQNNLHELWALLNLLHPDWFPKSDAFDNAFQFAAGGAANADINQLTMARELLRPLMLRRLKVDVEQNLPPKLETTIKCPLSQCQRFWYKRLLFKGLRDTSLLHSLEAEASAAGAQALTGSWKKLQSLMMQLRKCCNHPYLFEGADPTPGITDQNLIDASGKLKFLDRLLHRLIAAGHRVVIFSQYTGTLDVIDDVLRFRGIRYCRLDGSIGRVQRTVDINAFNQPGSRIPVFIMSTRAGGLGVNLQTADTVILFDSDWNPQADLQAMARVHRIGQQRPVHVYRLVTEGTVEERIVQRAEAKLYLDRMVNTSKTQQDQAKKEDNVNGSEMLSALTFGADAMVSRGDDEEDEVLDDAAIDAIIDRTRSHATSIDGLIQGNAAKQVNSYDSAKADVVSSIRQLKGVLYEKDINTKTSEGERQKKRKNEGADLNDISAEWAQLLAKKRAKKARVVMTKVKNVGMVPVLASSIDMNDDDDLIAARDAVKNKGLSERERKELEEREAIAKWEAEAARAAIDAVSTRQRAGRDYDHEDHCLSCQDGGELILCDFCPAAYHEECLIAMNFPLPGTKGLGTSWSCPHHTCATCNRKSGAAGGLLFRCSVCPNAYCEDHLAPSARIIGRCDRFEALGQRHPQQACFIICSEACVKWAKESGDIVDQDDYGTASGILGATGLDTTAKNGQEEKKINDLPPQVTFKTDVRKDLDRLDDLSRNAVIALAGKTTPTTLGQACPRLRLKLHDDPTLFSPVLEQLVGLVLAQDDGDVEMSDEKTPVIETVAAWRGAYTIGPATGIKQVRERMASVVLRIERMLETFRTYELQRLGRLLDVLRLNPRETNPDSDSTKIFAVAVNEASGFNRKMLTKIISIFLAWPLQTSLWAVKASPAMLGEHEAWEAERAALKKGKGITKRRAEALRLRQLVDEKKRNAIYGDTFLYPLCPPEIIESYGFPLPPQSTITVYTHRIARDAPTTTITVVGRQTSYSAPSKKSASSSNKPKTSNSISAKTVIASPPKKYLFVDDE